MANCKCASGKGNTGTVNCLTELKDMVKMFVVPTFKSDGTKNKILISTTLNQAWLDALINHTDESQRWLPLGEFENVTNTRTENTFETAASNRKSFLAEGIRSFSLEFWGNAESSPQFLGQLKGMKCTDMSIYILDRDFNLVGVVPATEDGYFYPIRLDKNSWAANAVDAVVNASRKKNVLTFDVHPTERDEQIRWIVPSEYTADLIGATGLLDIFSEFVSATTTTLVVDLFNRFGTAKTKQPMVGLVAADFKDDVGGTASRLYNLTDSLAVTIVSVTESPDGRYTFTFAAQTVADVIRITPEKNGYDFTEVSEAVDNIIA